MSRGKTKIKKLRPGKHGKPPGLPPGTLLLRQGATKPKIVAFHYREDLFEEVDIHHAKAQLTPMLSDERSVTWIAVRGLGDEMVLHELAHIFKIHPLALEDIVQGHQRPKVEDYDHNLCIITRMIVMQREDDIEAAQLSLVVGKNYVVTFQDENTPDALAPIRDRVRKRSTLIRRSKADFLCYAVLDTIVDHYFPVLEAYGEYLETLEYQAVAHPSANTLTAIHTAKRELMDLRRVLWPLRESLNQLLRCENPLISREVHVFLRDVVDHSVQVMDLIESYRDITAGLHDLYLSAIGHRTNEIMKVLTIISTIFIPLTFVAGVYGMNFSVTKPDKIDYPWNMPELYMPFGYVGIMGMMASIAAALMFYFWRLGWIFSKDPLLDVAQPEKHVLPPDAPTVVSLTNGDGKGSGNGNGNGHGNGGPQQLQPGTVVLRPEIACALPPGVVAIGTGTSGPLGTGVVIRPQPHLVPGITKSSIPPPEKKAPEVVPPSPIPPAPPATPPPEGNPLK